MSLVYLGLGSNIGDRKSFIEQAISLLSKTPGIKIIRAAKLIETKPEGNLRQDNFLNTVLEVETNVLPKELLAKTQSIEAKLGRVRAEHWGPRNIDIDILLYDDLSLSTPGLIIPHSELHKRNFVLQSLIELCPELMHPLLKRTMLELVQENNTHMDNFVIATHSPEETKDIAKKLAKTLPAPYVIALIGQLGAGKTTFIKGFCEGLHVNSNVHSPSFTLLNLYKGDRPVYHLDYYRLNNETEIELIGLDEYLPPAEGFTVIEWANNAPHLLPEKYLKLEFADKGEFDRQITFSAQGETADLIKRLKGSL